MTGSAVIAYPTTTNPPVIWMPLSAPLVTDVKILVGDPSPGARICYTATEHPRWARSL